MIFQLTETFIKPTISKRISSKQKIGSSTLGFIKTKTTGKHARSTYTTITQPQNQNSDKIIFQTIDALNTTVELTYGFVF